ncbi:hypothetical protein Hdeb2414_s0015g00439991 [Helianthus debilis subsp. tardiflorus]
MLRNACPFIFMTPLSFSICSVSIYLLLLFTHSNKAMPRFKCFNP